MQKNKFGIWRGKFLEPWIFKAGNFVPDNP